MKSLTELWRVLAYELASICHTSATQDYKTVLRRVKHEGDSYLTITLPAFAKDFERSLDVGQVSDDAFAGFQRRAGLPVFLGGFLRNVFDEHGAVKPTTDIVVDSIFAIRQLCAVFGKIERPCTQARNARAIHDYIVADSETGAWEESRSAESLDDFSRIASLLFSDVSTKLEQSIFDGSVVPRHGPGAVAERLRGNAKYDLSVWPERLDAVFPYTEFGVPGLRYHYLSDRVQFPREDEEMPSRVILVPKTQKTPRVIAAEPAALQYMQGGISAILVDLLESKDSLVCGMVGFADQTVNQEMAREGSREGVLATLDMSEASDRVSAAQALALFRDFPWIRRALNATRSTCAQTPDGEVIRLRKFASMGSALCFPIEAMVFLTAVFVGIERELVRRGARQRLTASSVRALRGSVRVYGDDIIVPVDCVDSVIEVFSSFGWKTNLNKSFWTGKFRESCGGDFYDGEWVTPVRFRRDFPSSRKDAPAAASLVSFRNQIYDLGLWETARWLDTVIRKVLPYYPVVASSSAVLGRVSHLPFQAEKIHPELQHPLVKGYVLESRIPRSVASGEGALLKCLLSSHEDPRHLERSGRPSVVDMKLRWRTPY